MHVCREVRKLKIPPHLAYGDRGVEGAIPGWLLSSNLSSKSSRISDSIKNQNQF